MSEYNISTLVAKECLLRSCINRKTQKYSNIDLGHIISIAHIYSLYKLKFHFDIDVQQGLHLHPKVIVFCRA